MGLPALRFPVSADLAEFRKNMDEAKSLTRQGVQQIAKQVLQVGDAFKTIGDSATSFGRTIGAAAGNWRPIIASVVAAKVAFEALQTVIHAVREQMAEMVEIADKANKFSVSPQFFQAWQHEADKLKVSAADMEGALAKAFDATKERAPIDASEWEIAGEKVTEVEKLLRIYNETVAKAAGTKLQGLIDFRNAETQEDRIKAVALAMTELERLGSRLGSLHVGESMFGAPFIDQIRRGNLSIQELYDRAANPPKVNLFSDETVKNVKDADRELQAAYVTASQYLKPTFEDLANASAAIERTWAKIIVALSKIANIQGLGKMFTPSGLAGAIYQSLADHEPPAPNGVTRVQVPLGDKIKDRGIGAPPKKKPGSGSSDDGRDRFDSAADSIEKRTAALEAEARTIDLGTAAREKAKIAAQLEAVAKQENGEITEAQREKIDRLATAYGNAAAKIEAARSPLATFVRESRDINKQINQAAASALGNVTDGLADMAMGTKSASAAFKSMADSIIRDLLRIAIRAQITGPIASALGLAGGGAPALLPTTNLGFGAPMAGVNFDVGGYTGPGGKHQVAGFVHKGEVIWSQDDVRRHGGPAVVDALRRGLAGYAGGGVVGVDVPKVAVPQIVIPTPVRRLAPTAAPNVTVHNYASGAQADVQTSSDGMNIEVIVKTLEGRMGGRVLQGRGAMAAAIAARRDNRHLR